MKAELLRQAVDYLKTEWEHLAHAALAGRHEASDEENRSESKYDTRGLEAGYLAEGQAEQANVLEEQIAHLNALLLEDTPDEVVTRGSIVVISGADQEDQAFFVLPYGGGAELDWQGQLCTVLTPEAPLGQQLVGRKAGDQLNDGRYISELY